MVAIDLDEQIAKYEADEEVQDLLNASLGLNLGSDFLPGAFGYDAHCVLDADEAAAIVWLDAFSANVDRTWRNPNLLVWHGQIWAIDHGAALYFHHGWTGGVHRLLSASRPAVRRPSTTCWRRTPASPRTPTSGSRGSTRRLSPTSPLRYRTSGCQPVPGAESVDAVRAAYVAFLPHGWGRPPSWLPRERRRMTEDRSRLPVRRAALRPERRPRGVRQRRRRRLQPALRLPSLPAEVDVAGSTRWRRLRRHRGGRGA